LDLGLHEVNDVVAIVRDTAHEEAHIIFGAVIDESLEDELRITLIATGFSRPEFETPAYPWSLRPTRPISNLEETLSHQRQEVGEGELEELPPVIEHTDRRLDIPTFMRRLVR
jgi:cell division protein FtsZ